MKASQRTSKKRRSTFWSPVAARRATLVAFGTGVVVAVACGDSNQRRARSQRGSGTSGSDSGAGIGPGGATGERGGSGGSSSGARDGDGGGEDGDGGDSGRSGSGGSSAGSGGTTSTGGATSGESGAAGEPASGGAGGEPEPPRPDPVCDDGNPCTHDIAAGSACEHRPMADGQRCEDQDLCTLGDRCEGGLCIAGTRRTGAGRALGVAHTYGTGVTATPGNGRFVFVDGFNDAHVTIADVVGTTLVKRSTAVLERAVGGEPLVAAWNDLVVFVDGAQWISLGGESKKMQFFSVTENGALTPHAAVDITPGAFLVPANSSVTGRGNRMFLCYNSQFFGPPTTGTVTMWDVTDRDAPVQLASGSPGGACGSIAVSEDLTRLYVNTSNGVRWADLTTISGTTITYAANPLVPIDSGIHVRGDRLFARNNDSIRLFDESDHTELGTITAPGAKGATFVDAGIFVQGSTGSGDSAESYVALYDLSGALVARTPVSRSIGGSVKAVAAGSYAMDTLTHRIFAVDASGFSEIDEPEVGVMARLVAGQRYVHSRSSNASHRVDVSDPSQPAIRAGGPARVLLSGLKLEAFLWPPTLVSNVDPLGSFYGIDPILPALRSSTATTRVERVVVDSNERYVVSRAFDVPAGEAVFEAAGEFIYRTAYLTSGGVHFQRFRAGDLERGLSTPLSDIVLEAPTGTPSSVTVRSDVDPDARTAVVAIAWWNATTNLAEGTLSLIDLSLDPPFVASEPLADAPKAVLIRDRKVAYSAGSNIVVRAFGVDGERRFTSDRSVERLLAFDGNKVYYAIYNALRAMTVSRAEGTELVLDLPTRTVPSSLVAADGALAASAGTELLTLAPACDD